MPGKQIEAVRRRWEASSLSLADPAFEAPDDESWGDLTAEPRQVDYLETEAGARPAMWAVPHDGWTDRVLLCLHGGGFVGGSIYTHRKMFGHLAKAARVRALLVSYRLLPDGGAYPAPAHPGGRGRRPDRHRGRHQPDHRLRGRPGPGGRVRIRARGLDSASLTPA